MTISSSRSTQQVLLVGEDPTRADEITKSLIELGFGASNLVGKPMRLLKEVSDQAPDVILIEVKHPHRELLNSLTIVGEYQPTPIAMFSSNVDSDYISDVIAAGVSTYLVGQINPAEVRSIIEIASAQFRSFQNLKRTLNEVSVELAERRTIEQAKVVLMRAMKADEQKAYEYMRRKAMNCNTRIAAIAKQIVESS